MSRQPQLLFGQFCRIHFLSYPNYIGDFPSLIFERIFPTISSRKHLKKYESSNRLRKVSGIFFH